MQVRNELSILNEKTTWLTDVSQVPNVNNASLKRALISLDGCGQKIKTAAIEELLKRTETEAQKECQQKIADLQETIKDLKSELESAEERLDRMYDREDM